MTSKEEFSIAVERFAKEKRCSYMDAVILYAEENNMEVESAARKISQSLKEKIEVEAQDLNFLPKSARLPI
jgi:hypothetical protein